MFFKKFDSTINVLIDPNLAELITVVPPNYSGKFLPDWFKKTPLVKQVTNNVHMTYDVTHTVRSCYAIKTHLTNGFILPMWCDLIIDIYPDGLYTYQFAEEQACYSITTHHTSQYPNFYEGYVNIKLNSPWVIYTKQSRKFYANFPFYHHTSPTDFIVMPGFIDWSSTSETNVNCLFKIKPKKYRVFIPAGFPLTQYLSTDNKPITLNIRASNIQELGNLKFRIYKFVNNHKFKMKMYNNKP